MEKAIVGYLTDLKVAGRSPTTLESYGQTLRAFCRHVGAHQVRHPQQVRADDVRGYLMALREAGDKSSTIRHQAIIIGCFFNWLIQRGNLRSNPMRQVTRPKATSSTRRPLAKEEVVAMLAVANRTRKATRNTAILYLLLDTGVRASELLGIHASDYSQATSTLTIMGKGNKQRTVRMGQRCKAAFEEYLAGRDDGLWGLTRGGLEALVERLGHKVGIHTYPHQFRHTFAAYWLENGGGLDELQVLLGHASIATTMIYVRVGQQDRALRSHAEHSPGDRLQ